MEELQHEASAPESGSSRRTFLASAGVGVAVVGAAVAAPAAALAGPSSAKLSDSKVVVTVADPAKGVFLVMHGEREVTVVDAAFANKIADAIA